LHAPHCALGGTEWKQAFLQKPCADYLLLSHTMMTDKLHLCIRSAEKLLTRLLFDVALKTLRVRADKLMIELTARKAFCMAEALLEYMKVNDDNAKGAVLGRGEDLLTELIQAVKPAGIVGWILGHAQNKDLGEHDQRVVALVLYVLYNFPLQLHIHSVEAQEIPEEECLSERVFRLQESGLKMLFVLHHHFADWAVRTCPGLARSRHHVCVPQLRGYFLNLFFILPLQLPYNIAYWQGRGFAQFSCCQWVELMVKMCNLVKNVAPHGTNQHYQKMRTMNMTQLWYLAFHNIRDAKRQDNGMRLDDRATLDSDKEYGIATSKKHLKGVGEYLEALEKSHLRVHRWEGGASDVPSEGPLMEMVWSGQLKKRMEEHRRIVEEQRAEEKELKKKQQARAKQDAQEEGATKVVDLGALRKARKKKVLDHVRDKYGAEALQRAEAEFEASQQQALLRQKRQTESMGFDRQGRR